MSYEINLEAAKEAKRCMSANERHAFDSYLIGVLSNRIPEEEWKDAIRMALSCFEKKQA